MLVTKPLLAKNIVRIYLRYRKFCKMLKLFKLLQLKKKIILAFEARQSVGLKMCGFRDHSGKLL